MVQKEVKKKTSLYATVAVLSALVLVSTIYVFGSVPSLFPNENFMVSDMKTFASMDEIKNYLTINSQGSRFSGGPLDDAYFGITSSTPSATKSGLESAGIYGIDSTHSTTNIQVVGVDETDIVKTDGQYIYTISQKGTSTNYLDFYAPSTTNAIYIVKADPQNPSVVARIPIADNAQPAGLFLSPDGTKLVILASRYQIYPYLTDSPSTREPMPMIAPYPNEVYTYVNVYDISSKASPVLIRNFTTTGSYFNSRMIGNIVYLVVSQPAIIYNDVATLPMIYDGQKSDEISATSVYYTDTNQLNYYTFTSFYGLDVSSSNQQLTNMTVMMDGTANMYVSPTNIYVTYPTWTETGTYTSIYRVSINGLQLSFDAKGSVPGYVLNQYSMDEYSQHFRIATTWDSLGRRITEAMPQEPTSMNNIYVLNMDLAIVGRLENLAQDERIYSARFMGEKAYLVTFKQVDPFFVIDLSDPQNPRKAGELKIPGYSSYLHPYDENYIIGVGKENNTVKLSLFDVTNVNEPTEVAKYLVKGDYADTPVLYEPKAFLFSKQKELLVIPVTVTNYGNTFDGSTGTSATEPSSKDIATSTISLYQEWQGAYVFKVTTSGFELRGNGITHEDGTTLQDQYWLYYNNYINRALYIDNALYTISNSQIKINNLNDLTQIATVSLQ